MKAQTHLDNQDTRTSTHILEKLLADTYVLYLKTQNFHWNVEDPRFAMLHKLWEEQYESLADAIDEVAERLRKIGSKAPGSMTAFLDLTRLSEEGHSKSGDAMLATLCKDHEVLIKELRNDLEALKKGSDEGTIDFLIGRLRAHEKMAWMLRSHLGTSVGD